MLAGLLLALGQPAHGAEWNPTASDAYANTAGGTAALPIDHGDSNTAFGHAALHENITGSSHTASGYEALHSNSTGTFNTALGYGAGSALTSGDENIYLGHPGMETASKTLRLGNSQTQAFVAGVAEAAVTGSTVFITSDGQLGVRVSSARYKQDIAPLGQLSEPLHQLHPVTFHYRQAPRSGCQSRTCSGGTAPVRCKTRSVTAGPSPPLSKT